MKVTQSSSIYLIYKSQCVCPL